jgi:hypothetical protein
MKLKLKEYNLHQTPVAHTCNPSYSGGREEEDHDLKPVWANSSQGPILKIPNTKLGWKSGSSGRVPDFKM